MLVDWLPEQAGRLCIYCALLCFLVVPDVPRMSVISLSPVVTKKQATWPDPSQLTTVAQLKEAMQFYEALESQIDNNLDVLISDRARLTGLLDHVDNMLPVVGSVQVEAQELAQRIDNTAQVAERISGQVRQLDEEQSRVTESIEMVQAVQDLKTAIHSIAISVEKHDWETATRHIQRARSIDPLILNSDYAGAVVVSLRSSFLRYEIVLSINSSLRANYLNLQYKQLTTSARLC